MSDRALRVATAAFTQAVVGAHDHESLAGIANGDETVLRQAEDRLAEVALGDLENLRRARILLRAAMGSSPSRPLGQELDDPHRLIALEESGLLDSDREEAFDRATRLATRLLGTPVSLVSVVDRDRQFFKSEVGLPEPWASQRETPLTHSFCRYVVESGHALAVRDSARHPLVAENKAIEDLDVAAYLGLPLEDADGNVLGSFCVISNEPRDWTAGDREALAEIAEFVVRELRLGRTVRHLAARLEQANATMAMLAHDVRAPLSALQQSVETVSRFAEGDLEQVVGVATRQVRRVERLAQALLEMRGQELSRQSFDLHEVVEELVADGVLGASAAERLANEVPPGSLVDAPRTIVEQILFNLVSNALKHTSGSVVVWAENDGDATCLVVADRGAGLGDDLENLLRPYARASSEEGFGLGLALVAHFVDRLEGTLEVDFDNGTIFRVEIPAPVAA